MPNSNIVKPVPFPPGLARLTTKPLPAPEVAGPRSLDPSSVVGPPLLRDRHQHAGGFATLADRNRCFPLHRKRRDVPPFLVQSSARKRDCSLPFLRRAIRKTREVVSDFTTLGM